MRNKLSIIFSALVVFALISSTFVPAQAAMVSTIDFEGLAEGAIVSNVSYGAGISGDPVSGSVAVYGSNPFFPNTNAAMIFDSACPGGCSGQDNDLYWPNLGKTLIVSEDMDSSDPDDSDSPFQYFTFDYASFGPGKVTVDSIVFGDVESVEAGGTVKLYGDSVLLATVTIPVSGNNVEATLPIGVAGVDFMRVNLKGSAAIDNIKIIVDEPPPPPPPGEEGCTPGYWKNHPKAWAPTGYTTTMTVEDVFDVPDAFNLDSKTLLQALSFQGGPYKLGAARTLLRIATAAVLNAAHPDVDYPLTAADIISQVNAALLGTRGQMLTLKDTLDMYNNLGCPIN
jgi:hypothetical protein